MSLPERVEADVAILMPTTNPDEYERVAERYRGLSDALSAVAVSNFFAYRADSYDAALGGFTNVVDLAHNPLADVGSADVVRDLTMPDAYTRELYVDRGTRKMIVNSPAINQAIQAGIDAGSALGFERATNLDAADIKTRTRLLSISGMIVAAATYENPAPSGAESKSAARKDYRDFIEPVDLGEEMHALAEAIDDGLPAWEDNQFSIYGIDVGQAEDGSRKFYSVLRKPLRVSAWDLRFPSTSHQTVTRFAELWDRHEAGLLRDAVVEQSWNN